MNEYLSHFVADHDTRVSAVLGELAFLIELAFVMDRTDQFNLSFLPAASHL